MFHGGTRKESCFKKGTNRDKKRTNFKIKFSIPTIKHDLSETLEMHGMRNAPIGQSFAFCRALLERHEKLFNRMTHADGRQLPMIIRHSFDTTELKKGDGEIEIKNG